MLTRLVACLFVASAICSSKISEPSQVIETSDNILEQEEIIEESFVMIEEEKGMEFDKPILRYTITSRYGMRNGKLHKGIDLAAPKGTSIYAAEKGVVKFSGWNSTGYGYLVIIEHKDNYETYYGHCSKLLVKVGDSVSKGDLIALVGSTGNSTGPHVHFEIRLNGEPLNPYEYIFEGKIL